MGRPFFYVKCCLLRHCKGQCCSERGSEEGQVDGQLSFSFHLVKDTLTSWRTPFELCKLLFLQHCCNVNKQNFFNLVRPK